MITYKLRLLKDLPEYPKDCVFILNDKGWRGYWEGGDWTIPGWLEALLNKNIPEVYDEMTDWFIPIDDEESTVYQVNIRGDIKERKTYNFWFNDGDNVVFESKEKAEEISKKLKELLND